ncbi:MAG: hypothetical protein ACREQJ_02280 [Candidatus Binatia bacterium]
MGSVVEYRCSGCHFRSGDLAIGWGKAGRARFWGGLARCGGCKELGVVDLNIGTRVQDRRCGRCDAPLAMIEGMSASVGCPRCELPMEFATVKLWS